MTFQKRKQQILEHIARHGTADVAELAALIGTSAMTIRRDLAQLDAEGLLLRTRGGATRPDLATDTFRYVHKATQRVAQKAHIARLAAAEIQDGETVFLDCGSTTFQLCPLLRARSITVITNSLPVVAALHDSAVRVNLVGGELDVARQAMHGLMAEWHIAQYRATRAFVGVDAVSLRSGLSANSEKEASITLAIARQADHVYGCCDSSKLETERYVRFAPLTLFTTLITDDEITPELRSAYEEAGVKVLC